MASDTCVTAIHNTLSTTVVDTITMSRSGAETESFLISNDSGATALTVTYGWSTAATPVADADGTFRIAAGASKNFRVRRGGLGTDLIVKILGSGNAYSVERSVVSTDGAAASAGGGDASAANQTTQITSLNSIDGHVDGLETLVGTSNTTLTAIDGHVDGIETLIGTTNTTLTTIDGRVDGVETLLAAIDGHVDGLEGTNTTIASATHAEDAVANSADVGVFSLAVIRAAPASNAATGDYGEFQMSPANGQFVAPTPIQVRITTTPTMANAGAYATGDVVGTSNTMTGAALASGRSGRIVGATLRDLAKQSLTLELWVFLLAPTLTNADNGVFAIIDADLSTAVPVGVIDFAVGSYRAGSASSVAMGTTGGGGGVDIPFTTSGSANLFCVFVARGAPTYASGDLICEFSIVQY